jgi:adenosine deaminase
VGEALGETLPPLADIHRHLDGSMRLSTLQELAERAGKPIPEDLYFYPGMGLTAALARFKFTLSLLDSADAVRRVAAEICEDAAREGVTTLEIRFAPHLHGGRLEDIVDGALEGIDNRAGLVLCALYGEPSNVVNRLVEVACERSDVAGIDLAGGPATTDPTEPVDLTPYVGPFDRAFDMGLGITVHAGEGRPPSEIRAAVEKLHAGRIGHGLSVLDDPAVAELMLEKDVTLEACITSNFHTGVIAQIADHPLPKWLERGLKACICTDNTLLSAVDAEKEHHRARSIPGMDRAKLERAIACGHAAAFNRS